MRKTFIITLILFVLFIATGFEKLIGGRIEIENMFFITTVGIDKEEEDNVKLTIISKQVATANGQGGQKEKNKYYSTEGRTIFEANRKFRSFLDKDVFWGHTDLILISEELAKTNITSYLDFFIRDHENRLTSTPLIVKGYTAEELIKMVTEEDEDITDKINAMLQVAHAISISSDVKLVEALSHFDNKYCSAYIPCIRIEEEIQEDQGNQENQENQEDGENQEKQETKKKVILDGYAIFDQDTLNLIGFIHEKRARGLNWIKNLVTSGVIIVKDPDEEKITLEIIETKTKITPEYKDDEWKVTIKVKMSSNIGEQYGTANVYNDKDIQNLNEQQQQIIKNEITDIINYAKENNIDLFDISGVINRKFPIKWEKEIKNNWRAIFQDITFDVEVDSKINRVYVIREPIKSKDGE